MEKARVVRVHMVRKRRCVDRRRPRYSSRSEDLGPSFDCQGVHAAEHHGGWTTRVAGTLIDIAVFIIFLYWFCL
jgi:hypothetical protein